MKRYVRFIVLAIILFLGICSGSSRSQDTSFITAKGADPVVACVGTTTVTAGQTRTRFTNAGAIVGFTLTLPPGRTGLSYEFIVASNHLMTIAATNSATIRGGAVESAANGKMTNTTVGSVSDIVAIDSTHWIITSQTGTSWSVS